MIWSQSALKDLEKEETCPFRWKAQWIDKLIPNVSNEDLDRGKYFEQLLLGRGAIAGDIINDLPRLDNGTKSTDQFRIEAQAERGKRILFDPSDPEFLGFDIVNSQLDLISGDEKGTADIVAVDVESHVWLIDVKLTKDLTNTRTIYGWGNDISKMDLLQLVHYQKLYSDMFPESNPKIGLLIFDYSTAKRVKFVEIEVTKDKLVERYNRFLIAKEAVTLYNKNGWIKTPNEKECDKCPLSCRDRKPSGKVIIEKVIY